MVTWTEIGLKSLYRNAVMELGVSVTTEGFRHGSIHVGPQRAGSARVLTPGESNVCTYLKSVNRSLSSPSTRLRGNREI